MFEYFETSDYEYKPLGRRQFRLIRLESADTYIAPLRCSFDTRSFDDPGEYATLSYHWGDPTPIDTVRCEEQTINIHANLSTALRRIRAQLGRWSELLLWTDALSINQTDKEEVAEQIQQMSLIYSQSSRLIIWLGEFPSPEAESAFESFWLRYCRPNPQSLPIDDTSLDSQSEMDAMRSVMSAPWFNRLWVVQEVFNTAVSKRWILVGSLIVSYDDLDALLESPEVTSAFSHPPLWTSWPSWPQQRITVVRPQEHKRDDSKVVHDGEAQTNGKYGLLQNIHMFYDLQCTDRHDRVYAMLGISEDVVVNKPGNIPIDYQLSLKQLSIALAMTYIDHGLYVPLLAYASCRRESSLPSWIPYWWQSDEYSSVEHADAIRPCNARKQLSNHRGRLQSRDIATLWHHDVHALCTVDIDMHLRIRGWLIDQCPAAFAVSGSKGCGAMQRCEYHSVQSAQAPWPALMGDQRVLLLRESNIVFVLEASEIEDCWEVQSCFLDGLDARLVGSLPKRRSSGNAARSSVSNSYCGPQYWERRREWITKRLRRRDLNTVTIA